MKGDENKPIDSNQLHRGNDAKKQSNVPVLDEHKPDKDKNTNTISINVEDSNSHKEAEPVFLKDDSVEAVHIEDSEATPTQETDIDIAEELKIEEPLESVAAIDTVQEPDTKPQHVSEPNIADQKVSNDNDTSTPSTNTPGVLVLQWLTYAFWGWTCLMMIWLTYVVAAHLIDDQARANDASAYILAAVLVLLPLSLGCDWFYSRKEPRKKTGASMVLMIIHAVIFALLAIGSLIVFMYALVQYMLVPPSDLTDVYVLMVSSIAVTVIYSAVFIRTLNPLSTKNLGLALSIFMFISVVTLSVLNAIGPVSTQRSIQHDDETRAHLNTLVTDINNYAVSKGSLPDNLSSSAFPGKDNPLVVNNSAVYTKYGTDVEVAQVPPGDDMVDFKEYTDSESTKLSFQVCVNYKVDTSYSSAGPLTVSQPSDHFYAPATHGDGKTCYDLYALANSSH